MDNFPPRWAQKRDFCKAILSHMQTGGYINGWKSAGEKNRHDYVIDLNSTKKAVIEIKGCLDGNNTNIFKRPPQAHEFVIWSLCTNPGANPRHNAWSGIHTRLSAEIIYRQQRVDGLMIWDMICGTVGRPCPKVADSPDRMTRVGQYSVPPPCIYLFPATIPSPRNNPRPPAQSIRDVELLDAFHRCFRASDEELNYVEFEVAYSGTETVRTTHISRNHTAVRDSKPTAIRRA